MIDLNRIASTACRVAAVRHGPLRCRIHLAIGAMEGREQEESALAGPAEAIAIQEKMFEALEGKAFRMPSKKSAAEAAARRII